MDNNLHAGHRERLRNRFIKNGINENTPAHEVLEVLLFYSIPRKNTNELAHTLIKEFGSLAGVIDAPESELMKIKGINKNTVVLLKLLIPIVRSYLNDKHKTSTRFKGVEDVGQYLLTKYFEYEDEVFSIVALDAKGKFLSFEEISRGDISKVGVSTRKIIEKVIKTGANYIIICHNHPGGIAVPSASDLATTKAIKTALNYIGVKLLDHIIIAEGDYVSLCISSRYKDMFNSL